MITEKALALDVIAEEARALHRVVRAMHDGHCPKCGYLGPCNEFEKHYHRAPNNRALIDHICPQCTFTVGYEEAAAALKAFQPYLNKSVAVFDQWRGYSVDDSFAISKIRQEAEVVYKALDYIRQRCDIMADDLKSELEARWIEELQAMGGVANAAIAGCMSISDQCESSS